MTLVGEDARGRLTSVLTLNGGPFEIEEGRDVPHERRKFRSPCVSHTGVSVSLPFALHTVSRPCSDGVLPHLPRLRTLARTKRTFAGSNALVPVSPALAGVSQSCTPPVYKDSHYLARDCMYSVCYELGKANESRSGDETNSVFGSFELEVNFGLGAPADTVDRDQDFVGAA